MAITKIGTPELFDFSATNTALQLPTGDTASRPSAPSAGEWRFNSQLKYVEYWDGGAWRQIDTEAPANPDDFPSQNFNVNTYFGNGATQAIDAKFNEAANFNGSSSKIVVANSGTIFDASGGFSASVWVNRNTTVNQTILNKEGGISGSYGWSLRFSSGAGYSYDVYDTSDNVLTVSTGANSTTGNWENIVISFNNSDNKLRIYYNGGNAVVSNALPSAASSNTEDFFIGARTSSGIVTDGKIDQVRIYSAAITDAQAEDLYTDETTTTAATLDFPVGAGCVAAYQLDGNANDISTNYNGTTTNIGYTGLLFQPDMIWIKNRVGNQDHVLFDSVRGVQKVLRPNTSDEQFTGTGGAGQNYLSAFNSNGFTVGDATNTGGSGGEYVAWCWYAPTSESVSASGSILASTIKKNVDAGFSIVQYDVASQSSSQQISHGLGVAPKLIIDKIFNANGFGWTVYTESTGTGQYLTLNADGVVAPDANFCSVVNDTIFQSSYTSQSNTQQIAYCFADIAGYQKVGSYTGTNSTNGPIVYTTDDGTATGTGGFEPAFLLIKGTQSSTQWLMIDNKRSTSNPRNKALFANLSDAEGTNNSIEFFTNGFQPITTDGDSNRAENYIYLAIAADKDSSVPTLANSFTPTLYTGNGATQNIYTPFAPDFTWIKSISNATSHELHDSVRGEPSRISSNTTAAASTTYNGFVALTLNGFSLDGAGGGGEVNTSGRTYVGWSWKAGGLPTINNDGDITSIVSANQASGFSIVEYTGNGAANATVAHGLGIQCRLVIVKRLLGGYNWMVGYLNSSNQQHSLYLNTTAARDNELNRSPQAFNTTTFQLGSIANAHTNGSTDKYIAYCFADIAGYQKIGSYTGSNSSSKVVTTGFQPRFLLIKSTTSNGNYWNMFDSARTTAPNGKGRLYANGIFAEDGTLDIIFDSTSFEILTSNSDINGSNDYLYLAIA